MPVKICRSILVVFCLLSSAALAAEPGQVNLGRWSDAELAQVISTAHRLDTPGAQIVAISLHFVAAPYAADTLIGGPQTAEQLVVHPAGFDCFTLLDTIEALRRASDPADFAEQLREVRYRAGQVSYLARRHFFSDWVAGDTGPIVDVTAAVGQGKAQTVVKQLNLKGDGRHWLPGLPVVPRKISYIPVAEIDRQLLSALQPGDYLGIYSHHAGLDVSHTGVLVNDGERFLLRHASSRIGVRRVVDVDLLEYLQGKPGLVVYRVIDQGQAK